MDNINKTKKNMIELFAGVGGFRVALEEFGWNTVFANQWEPGKAKQWAFNCYDSHYKGTSINSNTDIAQVKATDIPDHSLLVGGFPCQDYSVAATLATSKGINGKKGVLWWEIRRIVEEKKPQFILLENVDRLLKSPAAQRGRDFGIILSCLNALGYSVEWRVVNAAEYGFVQRRRRTFIFATKKEFAAKYYNKKTVSDIILRDGFFASTFPVKQDFVATAIKHEFDIPKDLVDLTNNFKATFENSGYCNDFRCVTIKNEASYDGPKTLLGDILEPNVPDKYYIDEKELPKWQYLKGAKKELRKTKEGFEYNYSEGPIAYPDFLDRPGRTMLTSEGTKNRSSHIIQDPQTGRMRILTPIECERMDGFPDNWTESMSERTRYFCMGNALVVGLIRKMGETLNKLIEL